MSSKNAETSSNYDIITKKSKTSQFKKLKLEDFPDL